MPSGTAGFLCDYARSVVYFLSYVPEDSVQYFALSPTGERRLNNGAKFFRKLSLRVEKIRLTYPVLLAALANFFRGNHGYQY